MLNSLFLSAQIPWNYVDIVTLTPKSLHNSRCLTEIRHSGAVTHSSEINNVSTRKEVSEPCCGERDHAVVDPIVRMSRQGRMTRVRQRQLWSGLN